MTEPTTRTVAGLAIPLDMVPRIVPAIMARYPEATAGITDPDAAVRAALLAWVVETLAMAEEQAAIAPLRGTVARTITEFEEKARQAREKALVDGKRIVEAPTG